MFKLILLSFFPFLLMAKSFTLNIYIDKESSFYMDEIKKEFNSLLSNKIEVFYNIKNCEQSCSKYLKKENSFFIFKNIKKVKIQKNSYLINYNEISNKYQKEKLIRTAALGIYEFLNENKNKTIYLKNEKFTKVKKDKKHLKLLKFKDLSFLVFQNNLLYKQNKNKLEIDTLEVNESKNLYKPDLSLYSNYIQMDKDRPTHNNGITSQGSLELGLKLKQILYSNKIIKGVKIQKLLQEANKNAIVSSNDEILFQTSLLYLNIIKAQKYEKIIQTKYNFIKQNLEFSKQRVKIGVKDRSDTFRWESELSQANIDLSNAKKDLSSLRIELFNLLRIENIYSFKEYSLESNIFKLLQEDAIVYISDKKVQNLFEKQMVFSHPILKQLKALLKAKKEEVLMNKDSRYYPIFALEVDAKSILNRKGEGKNISRAWDDEEYQIVLNMNIPLYESGSKNLKIKKNYLELKNLNLQYEELKSLIIQNVRSKYINLKSSFEKIEFSKRNLKYSLQNFNLIADKYKNGEENIITLLDAQNAYIYANLNLNISVVDYLVDLSSIYFNSGKIKILFDDEIKKEVEKNIKIAIKE